jgi:hypothetical protein
VTILNPAAQTRPQDLRSRHHLEGDAGTPLTIKGAEVNFQLGSGTIKSPVPPRPLVVETASERGELNRTNEPHRFYIGSCKFPFRIPDKRGFDRAPTYLRQEAYDWKCDETRKRIAEVKK